MAIIKAVSTESSFYKEREIDLIKNKVEKIKEKYSEYIKKASALSKVPELIIYSFIFIESGGKENAISSANAYGLMQLTIPTAIDTLRYEIKMDRLSKEEKEYLKKFFGHQEFNKMFELLKKGKVKEVKITKEHLLNPEINIFIGTMYLGQLMDYFTEGNETNMAKVVVAYNTGKYSKTTQKLKSQKGLSVNEIIAIAPKETSNYIKKLVGKNGLLDILTA